MEGRGIEWGGRLYLEVRLGGEKFLQYNAFL